MRRLFEGGAYSSKYGTYEMKLSNRDRYLALFSPGPSRTNRALQEFNRALKEVYDWCSGNQLTPDPGKTEAMLLCRGNPMGSIAPVFLGDACIKCATKARVLGLTVDHKLTWDAHLLDVRSFANKLDLLKRSRFLPKSVWRDFNFKVILPSVKYGD